GPHGAEPAEEPRRGREHEVALRDEPGLVPLGRGAVRSEARVLVHAVVDDRPAVPLAQAAGQGLPGGILDEADGFGDAVETRQASHGLRGLLQGLALELAAVEVEVELAGQSDLVDAIDSDAFHPPERRLAVQAQESGARVEDAVAVAGERREQLLGALEAEPP